MLPCQLSLSVWQTGRPLFFVNSNMLPVLPHLLLCEGSVLHWSLVTWLLTSIWYEQLFANAWYHVYCILILLLQVCGHWCLRRSLLHLKITSFKHYRFYSAFRVSETLCQFVSFPVIWPWRPRSFCLRRDLASRKLSFYSSLPNTRQVTTFSDIKRQRLRKWDDHDYPLLWIYNDVRCFYVLYTVLTLYYCTFLWKIWWRCLCPFVICLSYNRCKIKNETNWLWERCVIYIHMVCFGL